MPPPHSSFCCGREQFRVHPESASPVREGINQIRACRFSREASRPAVQKSTMRRSIFRPELIANMATIPKPVLPARDWRENDPLLTPQQVAERLNTSLDWVWDHSSRKTPLLPVIRFGDGPGRAGMLRYRASKIEEFILEQERFTNTRRRKSGCGMLQPTCSPTEIEE
jgi:hypothetical protein